MWREKEKSRSKPIAMGMHPPIICTNWNQQQSWNEREQLRKFSGFGESYSMSLKKQTMSILFHPFPSCFNHFRPFPAMTLPCFENIAKCPTASRGGFQHGRRQRPRHQRSSHHCMVTRLPNHWCANSLGQTAWDLMLETLWLEGSKVFFLNMEGTNGGMCKYLYIYIYNMWYKYVLSCGLFGIYTM